MGSLLTLLRPEASAYLASRALTLPAGVVCLIVKNWGLWEKLWCYHCVREDVG